MMDSILQSVKKMLGIDKSCGAFDADILMNINAAIYTLRQLGVGPKEGFTVISEEEIYEDYLGPNSKLVNEVKMYLYYKTRLAFDPPSSTAVLECLKEMIAEAEWRLHAEVDPKTTFDDEKYGEVSHDTK